MIPPLPTNPTSSSADLPLVPLPRPGPLKWETVTDCGNAKKTKGQQPKTWSPLTRLGTTGQEMNHSNQLRQKKVTDLSSKHTARLYL